MALENVRGVVFDAFGTLVEIGERRRPYLRLMKLAAAAGRRPQPDDAAKMMSMNCDIFGVADWLGVEVSDALRAEIEADLAAELGSIALFSDALPVIDYLRSQGIKVAVCSNLAQPYAAPVKALLPEMDVYVWSFEVGAVKPDHRLCRDIAFGTAEPAMAMYKAACEKLGLPPEQILMVGDTLAADVLGPRKFGINARHLARHGGSPDAGAVVSLLDLFSAAIEKPGWQECIDEQTGKRTWVPMPLYTAYQRQQLAMRGLLIDDFVIPKRQSLAEVLAAMPDVGTVEDFSRHKDYALNLGSILSSIQNLAAQPSDVEIFSLVRTIDWRTLADEFEPVVGRYRNAVYKYARHLIKNLRRPYLRYHDHCQLRHWSFMLDRALSDSPSLMDTADAQVAKAWKHEIGKDVLLARKVRGLAPIETLAQLREAVAEKRRHGEMLEASRNLDYANCGRVQYPSTGIPNVVLAENGIQLTVGCEVFFLAYKDFPWFQHASAEAIKNVQMHGEARLCWPDLDVDLTLECVRNPEKFPLFAKTEPAKAVGVLPAYACASCGAKHGAGGNPDANTWQHGVCGICGLEALVSEFRNFRGQAADMLGSDAEYRAALREASAFFENEPEPGTPEGARFEALLATIEAYEAKHFVDPKTS